MTNSFYFQDMIMRVTQKIDPREEFGKVKIPLNRLKSKSLIILRNNLRIIVKIALDVAINVLNKHKPNTEETQISCTSQKNSYRLFNGIQ